MNRGTRTEPVIFSSTQSSHLVILSTIISPEFIGPKPVNDRAGPPDASRRWLPTIRRRAPIRVRLRSVFANNREPTARNLDADGSEVSDRCRSLGARRVPAQRLLYASATSAISPLSTFSMR